MSLEHRIRAVGLSLDTIAHNLRELGYRFEDDASVLPGPEAGSEEAIQRIQNEVGPLPLVLKLFWTRVGSVNLIGHHADWQGCEYPDPVVVYPPSVAVQELAEFLDDREERLRCNFPYAVPIAPDALHKANVSGGMWYNVEVPASADDPPLQDEPHATTFLRYLEFAIGWGGFPGLESCPDHAWPIAQITRGTRINP